VTCRFRALTEKQLQHCLNIIPYKPRIVKIQGRASEWGGEFWPPYSWKSVVVSKKIFREQLSILNVDAIFYVVDYLYMPLFAPLSKKTTIDICTTTLKIW
jgi:hypothetical protein